MLLTFRGPLRCVPQQAHNKNTQRPALSARFVRSVRSPLSCKSTSDKTGSPGPDTEDEETIGLGLKPYKEGSRLVSDNWVGDEYRGSNFNILTLLLGLIFFVPIIGLAFAYFSYGSVWGTVSYFSY